MKFINKILRNKAGATAIEYGLIAALISVAAIGAFTSVGGGVNTAFGTAATGLTTAAG